jgi:hypothetical protein
LRVSSFSCHTGEGRCLSALWIPAFAGKTIKHLHFPFELCKTILATLVSSARTGGRLWWI